MKHFFKSAALVLILTLVIVQLPQILRQVQEWRYPRCYAAEVEGWAAAYDLDPLLIYSFIHTESSFDPEAESSVGARGLMQMTEETFYWIKSKIAPDEALNFDSLYDPDCSIRFGAYYLKLCLERYGGDIATAAAAYHSGWGTVDALLEHGQYTRDGTILAEFPYTQMAHYVQKILERYQCYTELYGS